MGDGLRDQHPIERIAVQPRQSAAMEGRHLIEVERRHST
jgi:hypothetical protein